VSIAGIQARLGIDAGLWGEKDLAEVAARSRADAVSNPCAQFSGAVDVSDLLDSPLVADPLRSHDIAPITDGAAVIVLASAERARDLAEHPAFITGIEHRVDSPVLGARDLTRSPSTRSRRAGHRHRRRGDRRTACAPFTHQELILRKAMGLDEQVRINPSGGALVGNPMFSAGLARIGEAARQILEGKARKTLPHTTSGPALQQNLVAVLERLD
jgi:acetyl-CoA acetyltransferase